MKGQSVWCGLHDGRWQGQLEHHLQVDEILDPRSPLGEVHADQESVVGVGLNAVLDERKAEPKFAPDGPDGFQLTVRAIG